MSAPVQVLVGSSDITGAVQELTFSNTDPGGYETLSMSAPDLRGARPGDQVMVRYGLAPLWMGRLNEPGETDSEGARP